MRTMVTGLLAAIALLAGAPVMAQDAQSQTPAANLPRAPVPYTTLRPRPKAASAARPRAATPGVSTVGSAVAGPVTLAQALPIEASGARLTPGQPLPPAELEAFVDGVVTNAMAREHIAGVTVAVVQNGQILLKKGYGFASLSPRRAVDPDQTLFRLGSISKTFTWIALMRQVEAGRIVLDRPVNLYLPERVQVRDQGYASPVRVKNLMDHSAGFEDRALGQLFERDFDRVRPLELYLRQERPHRVHAPGAVSAYSNYGAALAGEAVAYVTGKTFERGIEDDILGPLGMTRTTFREPHPQKAGLPGPMPQRMTNGVAQGYRWAADGFHQRPYEYIGQIAPAGSASSTAGDMSRYMLMMLGGGQLNGVAVYGPRAATAFRTPLRRTPPGVNGWAHGLQVKALPGGYMGYGHGGATLSFMSDLTVAPQLGLGVFISTNTETGQPLAARFANQVVSHFYAAPMTFPRQGSPEIAAERGVYAGHYLTSRRAYGGLEGFISRLISGSTVNVTADGRLIVAELNRVRTFAPDDSDTPGRFIADQGSEHLAFALRDGQALAYQDSSGAALIQRAPFWAAPALLLTFAGLTLVAAVATLGGLILRNRREFRQNGGQSRASLWQNIQAGLWLIAFILFGVWVAGTGDIAEVMYRWPGPLLITASACALVAAALTLATLIALPAIWQGGRRVDSWTPFRKMGFTLTVLIYTGFSVLLGLWGALSPWSG